MNFTDIWCQKEATWNTFVGNFERWRGPQTSWGPGKLPLSPSQRACLQQFQRYRIFRTAIHLFDTPLLFRQKFWGVVGVPYGLEYIDPWCWVCKELRPMLINREIVLDVLQRVWSQYLNVTGRRTNGDSLLYDNTALELRIASRGKN